MATPELILRSGAEDMQAQPDKPLLRALPQCDWPTPEFLNASFATGEAL